ncbi:MAG TPA: hypothetical protein PK734_04460, partial [Bacteroidales bacterium]|nr:hypothetical protein [Bacteroidales bacterium]
ISMAQQPKDSLINYMDITGKKQGYWCKRDAAGNKVYEGTFKNDVPVGEFKKYHQNGKIKYLMIYNSNNSNDVQVTMYDITGELSAKGFYYNKIKHGTWQYFGQQEKLLMEEHYTMGKLDGASTIFWQVGNNLPAEIKHWKDSVKHGDWFWFYETGQMRMKAGYSNGKLEGPFIVYFFDGKIHIQGAYVNDRRNGVWNYYNEDGTSRAVLEYNMGTLVNEDEVARKETKLLQEKIAHIPTFSEPNMTNPENYLETPQSNQVFDPEDPQNFIQNPEAYIFKSQMPEEQAPDKKSKKNSQKNKK